MTKSVSLLVGFLWLFLALPMHAAQVDDIRILIDVSGSMQKTDPENLRVPALRLINGLIPTGSKAGVWTFGRYVNMEVKWGKVDAAWRKRADAGANKIHSKGQFTNIEGALKRATKGWEKDDPKTSRNLILLTDGKVDISKDKAKNAQSRSNVLDKSIPGLLKRGIKVHTIALSDQTDEALLKRIALKTSGSFEVARSADDLQRIFFHMFERATKPDTVPLKDNAFTVDKSISEMTILVFRKGNKETQLIQPDKKQQTQSKHSNNVSWRFERGYDLITVTKPQPGKWSLIAKIDDDNRVMIVTKLKLIVDDLPAYMTPDKPINVKVELHNNDKKISKKSFLKFVDFKQQHKIDEEINEIALKLKKSRDIKDKGIYLSVIPAPLSEGKHEIIVKADARTFTRSKKFSIQVQWPVIVELNKTGVAGIYRLNILAREEYIKADTLQLELVLKNPDQSEQEIKVEKRGNLSNFEIKANQQDGLHQLQINMKAESIEGQVIEHKLDDLSLLGVKADDEPVEVVADGTKETDYKVKEKDSAQSTEPAEIVEDIPEDEKSDVITTTIYISIVNLIVILIIAGVVFYLRKQSREDDIDLLDGETDSDEA